MHNIDCADNLKLNLPIENDEEEQAATPVAVSKKTPSKQSATKRKSILFWHHAVLDLLAQPGTGSML